MRGNKDERKLVDEIKRRGGMCLKWVCQGFDGMPDRLVFLPDGKFGMVELKSPKKKPRPLQKSRHRMLKRLGFKVYVIDDVNKIGGVVDEIQST